MNPSSARSPSPGTTRPPGDGRSNVPNTASEIWKTARRAPARRTASSGSRSIQQFPTSAMTPMPARSATSVPSRRVCTNDTSVRNDGSIASVTPRDSAYFAHGATASASDVASSSNERPSRRPGVKYVHPPTSAARSIESLTAARVASQLVGSDRSNIDVITVVARIERSRSAAIAASRPNASTLLVSRPDLPDTRVRPRARARRRTPTGRCTSRSRTGVGASRQRRLRVADLGFEPADLAEVLAPAAFEQHAEALRA